MTTQDIVQKLWNLCDVLRDDLQLNGAKFGCGLGQCGAEAGRDCAQAVDFAGGVDPARIPRVIDHRRRMSERPGVKKAIAEELA